MPSLSCFVRLTGRGPPQLKDVRIVRPTSETPSLLDLAHHQRLTRVQRHRRVRLKNEFPSLHGPPAAGGVRIRQGEVGGRAGKVEDGEHPIPAFATHKGEHLAGR